MRTHKARGRKPPDRRGWIATVCLLLAIAAAWALLWFRPWTPAEPPAEETGLGYESNIIYGAVPGKTREERQAELDAMVEAGRLSLSINASPCGSLSEDGCAVNWLIENPSNQGKFIRVEITRDDTGELVYETGAIPPGSYVTGTPPDVPLDVGAYACTAMFYSYALDTEAYIGRAAAQIKLTILP